jgi:hypothetical protein
MDDVALSRFTYRNEEDPLKWTWLIDWNDNNNFKLIKNFTVYRSYLLTNRGTKRLLRINTIKQIEATQKASEDIEKYLIINKQL